MLFFLLINYMLFTFIFDVLCWHIKNLIVHSTVCLKWIAGKKHHGYLPKCFFRYFEKLRGTRSFLSLFPTLALSSSGITVYSQICFQTTR